MKRCKHCGIRIQNGDTCVLCSGVSTTFLEAMFARTESKLAPFLIDPGNEYLEKMRKFIGEIGL